MQLYGVDMPVANSRGNSNKLQVNSYSGQDSVCNRWRGRGGGVRAQLVPQSHGNQLRNRARC